MTGERGPRDAGGDAGEGEARKDRRRPLSGREMALSASESGAMNEEGQSGPTVANTAGKPIAYGEDPPARTVPSDPGD